MTIHDSWRKQWAVRVKRRDGEWVSHAHYIESVVNGVALTNCGREMKESTSRGLLMLLVVTPHPNEQCEDCRGADG